MYLGRKSLAVLWSWLHGYDYAKLELRVARSAEEEEFEGVRCLRVREVPLARCRRWVAKIAYHHGDDADAFDKFFKLLDEFRESRRQPSEEKT